MKSISSLAVAAVLFGATTVVAVDATLQGCFESSTGLSLNSSSIYNSRGYCSGKCGLGGENVAVMAMGNGTNCWCGDTLPPSDMMVDSSLCNIECPGYPPETCGGGTQYWSVYLSGTTSSVTNAADSTSDQTPTKGSSTPSTTATAKASVVTLSGETVVVTASTDPKTKPAPSSGPNKAAIAAGVIVGIVAIGAIAGGVFLFIRNKRRREVEEEYRRNAAVSSFIHGKAPDSSSGGSVSDTRLDPAVMAQRRMSDGSIADNQDYSRRILKVTNA